MKILFHTGQLNFRGTSVAIRDYAHYNQEILGNESIISYNADSGPGSDGENLPYLIEMFSEEFELRPVVKYEYDEVCKDIDLAYFLRGGDIAPLPTITKSAVHSVFPRKPAYGDKFAYISEWLSRYMSNGEIPWVPHMINLPEANEDYREHFNISKDKIIIGRYGGYHTFDLPFVHQAIVDVLNTRNDIVFLMVHTQRFFEHPNIIYVDPIVDLQTKSNFINTCDGFLHARSHGESFGLAVVEPLWFNKPVLSWNGGNDRHHIDLLNNTDLLYSVEDIKDKLLNIKSFKKDYYSIVEKFNPQTVMTKFKDVFLT